MEKMLALPSEVWKDIEGYEGVYQVSSLGNVRSLDRNGKGKGNAKKGKILKQDYKKGTKYLRVTLYKKSTSKHYSVHRLVAQEFIPNPDNLPQVNHKDENKENNCVGNLEWCTATYNANYGTKIERQIEIQRLTMSTMKAVRQYTLDNQLVAEYISIKAASRQTGLFASNISACCRNIALSCGGYRWCYV